MKKFLSLAVLGVIFAVGASSQAEAKCYLVGNLFNGTSPFMGPGLRGEMGNLVWDINTSVVYSSTAPAATNKTIPIYFDVYMGSWGLAAVAADVGAGVTNYQLQYAVEQWVNDKVGVGLSFNVIDYQALAKTLVVANGLNAYLILPL